MGTTPFLLVGTVQFLFVGTAGNLLVDTVRFASGAPPAPTARRPPLEISPIGLLPDAPLAPPRPNHLAGNATNRTSSSPGPSPRPPNPGQHSSRQHPGGNCYETTMPVDMSELLSLSLRNVVQNYIQTQKSLKGKLKNTSEIVCGNAGTEISHKSVKSRVMYDQI